MNFNIEFVFSEGPVSTFLEGPGPGPGPLYKVFYTSSIERGDIGTVWTQKILPKIEIYLLLLVQMSVQVLTIAPICILLHLLFDNILLKQFQNSQSKRYQNNFLDYNILSF